MNLTWSICKDSIYWS